MPWKKLSGSFLNQLNHLQSNFVNKLCESYWRLNQCDSDDENFGESELGAMGCVTTIKKIFESVRHKHDLLLKLEKVCFKVFAHSTTPDGSDGIEESMECETMIMYYADHLSEEMWTLVPHLFKIVTGTEEEIEGGFGFEYFNSMVDFFRNLIRLGKDQLWERKIGEQTYFDLIVKNLYRVVEISKTGYSDSDAILAFRVFNSLLENLPGKLDTYIPHFLKLVSEEFMREDASKHYITILCEHIFSSMYYSPEVTFKALQELNCLDSMLKA